MSKKEEITKKVKELEDTLKRLRSLTDITITVRREAMIEYLVLAKQYALLRLSQIGDEIGKGTQQ